MKRRSKRVHKKNLKLTFTLTIVFILAFAIIADLQMRPLIKAMAATVAQSASVTAVNQAVVQQIGQMDMKYSDFVTLEKDQNGKILALTSNMKNMNELKSKITLLIQQSIFKEKRQLKIPLGTLLGTELLNGHGPKIPLEITMSGSVIANFRSGFESQGINQTKHQLYLDISTNAFALVPGYPATTSISTSVLIAETVLIGDVPSFYAQR